MSNWLVFAFVIIAQLSQNYIVKGQDPPPPPLTPTKEEVDKKLYDSYKKEVCDRVPSFTGSEEPAPKWVDAISESEVLELSFINMAYGLNSDSISHLKPELGWKKTVVDMISLITKTTCKDDVISESYLNAAKNLYLYYLSRVNITTVDKNKTAEERGAEWTEVLESLSTCANGITEIDITTQCGIASTYEGKDGGGQPIVETVEKLDEELADGIGLDAIIDTVWWMFSTTYSRCYAYFYPNEDVILLFFQMFREDFLQQFLTRWTKAGENTEHFPIIFGPYDFKSSSENVRKCASAAFQYEGLSERQLVRPVMVTVVDKANGGASKMVRNFKVKG